MKHYLCIVLLLFVITPLRAQFFLTPSGFTVDDGKDYYVLTTPEKNQQELFDAVYAWAGRSFVSPQDVISSTPNASQITINGIVIGLTKMPKRAIKVPVDVNFTWIIQFKEGRIRFNAPIINSMEADGRIPQSLHLVRPSAITDGIFKRDGALVDEFSKNQLEQFFNGVIKEIEDSIQNRVEDDW